MKTEIKEYDKTVGKKIKEVRTFDDDQGLFILFSDDKYIALGACRSCDDIEIEILSQNGDIYDEDMKI